jgi:hypothetical protein
MNRSRRNYGNGATWEVNIKPFDERWKYPQLPMPKDDPGKVY